MTKISNLELAVMEMRHKRMIREDALKEYRRAKKPAIAAAKSVKSATEPSFGKKLDEATAALLATGNPSPEATDTPQTRAGFVLWRLDLSKDAELPFNSAALVMEIGATIGDKIILHQTDPDLIAVGTPSFPVPIAKLGTQRFTVYRDQASASAAAERENAGFEAYKRAKKKA